MTRDELIRLMGDAIVGSVHASDVLAAIEAAGLRIVPAEPTEAMGDAAYAAWINHRGFLFGSAVDAARAAIAASPLAPEAALAAKIMEGEGQ